MKIERTGGGIVYFYVDEEYLRKYNLNIETFRDKKPFKVDIFDALLEEAIKEYNVKFNKNTVPKSICVRENFVIFEVREKSKFCVFGNKSMSSWFVLSYADREAFRKKLEGLCEEYWIAQVYNKH